MFYSVPLLLHATTTVAYYCVPPTAQSPWCSTASHYYVQLEDDVQSAPGFVSDVRRFVDKHSSAGDGYNWALLEFSELGFIGKLLRFSRHCHLDPCCARPSGRSSLVGAEGDDSHQGRS